MAAASPPYPPSTPPSKAWRIAPGPPAGFADALGFPPLHARLLYNRGVRTRDEARAFLDTGPDMEHDPGLMPGMARAVERLEQAARRGEKIGVFGDFDVDGITGAAILSLGLRQLGAEVMPYIPHRDEEGHGLNAGAVRELAGAGVTVCVTVDCGLTDAAEVALASELGIDTIITDHHTPGDSLPPACAVVHAGLPGSRYPFADLTGAGMAYKLVCAMFDSRGRPRPERLLELVALGTVADVGRMEGENRYFVSRGLRELKRSRNEGLKALMAAARVSANSLDETNLSFYLIPRLNAPGRIGKPQASLSLLTTNSPNEAQQLATELEYLNRERRELTAEAMAMAGEQVRFPGDAPPIIFVKHPEWQPGVLGLVAGQLSEQYTRPAIAVSVGGEVSRASARSIPELHLVDALRSCEDLLIRFGGHHQAAGFSAKTGDLPAIESRLREYAASRLDVSGLMPAIDIDCELPLSGSLWDAVRFIDSLGPFGQGNPRPTFLARNVSVVEARPVGSDGGHLKLTLYADGNMHDAIAFRMGDRIREAGGTIDVVFTPSIDEWRGRERLQLTVRDFSPGERG